MMIGKKSSSETVLVTHETNIKDFISTFLITLSNPITMIAFVAALSNINYLIPVVAFFLGALILGEDILLSNLLALVLIISGIFVSRFKS